MLFLFKPAKPEVLQHWYTPLEAFTFSTQDFYAAIEKELKDRQIPGLDMSRVEYAEGGILSAKRTYLHMMRERLTFDICAAPFGTGYFFSLRCAEPPAMIRLWHLLTVGLGSLIFTYVFWKLLGFVLGSVALVLAIALAVYVFRNAVALGLHDLDAWLVKDPLFGPIYDKCFRKETYYRHDTRLMYLHTIDEVVKQQIEEITGAKGIKLLRYREHSPILDELYRAKDVPVSQPKP